MSVVNGDLHNQFHLQHSRDQFSEMVKVRRSLTLSESFLSFRIYVKHHFPNLTLTAINFIVTFLLLIVCMQAKLFTFVRLPILSMIPVSICFGGFIAFSNLSLQYNTVGTYQLIKLQVTPSTCEKVYCVTPAVDVALSALDTRVNVRIPRGKKIKSVRRVSRDEVCVLAFVRDLETFSGISHFNGLVNATD